MAIKYCVPIITHNYRITGPYYSILRIKGKQRKLVKADKTISHFKPTSGSRNAPDKLLATPERLFMLHKSANDVASRPLTECRAIKSITIRNINIPKKL